MGGEYWAIMREKSLKHYGILGMKWGVRRTPEELGHKVGAARESRSSLDIVKSNPTKRVVAYAIEYRCSSLRWLKRVRDYIREYNDVINNEILERRKHEQLDSTTGFYMKNTEMSKIEDMHQVNPLRDAIDRKMLGEYNCMLCTTTYELRRRGYDVMANMIKSGYALNDLKRWFVNPKIKSFANSVTDSWKDDKFLLDRTKQQTFIKEVVEQLSKEPSGSRGNFVVNFAGVETTHSMAYEIENGVPVLYDCQTDRTYYDLGYYLETRDVCGASYVRTDNLKLRKTGLKEVAS